jgi:tetratricopeptide (TPR) repeat protein
MFQINKLSWVSIIYCPIYFRLSIWIVGILCVFFSTPLPAQIKAIKPFGEAYALVVGISDYQHEKISDLTYADADAKAFAHFLEEETAWKIRPENVVLLLNEEATYGRFIAELSAIGTQLEAKDRLLLYFSGHGDVEYLNEAEKMGFLLFYDTSPTTYEGGGACKVNTLDQALSKLVLERQVQVILITDACRSGNLAGSSLGGPNATTAALASLFQNTIKILSCEPAQYSLEGPSWGGGRGLFSYHLVEGLKGNADENKDLYVNLLELERYVQDRVLLGSNDQQLPLAIGSKTTRLSKVDPAIFSITPENALTQVTATDSTINLMNKYVAFQTALEEKHLLYPVSGAAFTLYNSMGDSPEALVFKKGMKISLTSALQDEAQQALNEYITSPAKELSRRWTNSEVYAYYPDYLDTAAALLGEGDYFYNDLKSRAHYFRGVNIRLRADEMEAADSLYLLALQEQQASLSYKAIAPHVFNEQGLIYRCLADKEAEMSAFLKAHEYSPKWGLALTNLAIAYWEMKDYGQAEALYKEAIVLDSTLSLPYHNLAVLYEATGAEDLAINYYQAALSRQNPVPMAYYNLAGIYSYDQDSLLVAEALLQKLLLVQPKNENAYSLLGVVYLQLEQQEKAWEAFQDALRIDPDNIYALSNLAYLNEVKEAYDQAIMDWYKAIEIDEQYYLAYLGLAINYLHLNNEKEALNALEIMLEKGYSDYDELNTNKVLAKIRDNRRFQQLLETYFPDRE